MGGNEGKPLYDSTASIKSVSHGGINMRDNKELGRNNTPDTIFLASLSLTNDNWMYVCVQTDIKIDRMNGEIQETEAVVESKKMTE